MYNVVELYFTEKQPSFFLRLSLLYKLLKKSCLPGCDYWPYHRHGYLAKAILLLVGIISLGRNGITCIDHKTLPWEWSAFIKGIFSLYCVTVQQAEKHFQNSIVLNCWDKILLFAWEAGNPPICNWPGFSSLTYNANSRDLSNSVFLGAESIEHLASQMEKQHNIHRSLNRLYIPAHGEYRQLLMCRNQAQHTYENTSSLGIWGPIFKNTCWKRSAWGKHGYNQNQLLKC